MLYYAKKAIEDDEYQPDNTPLYKKVLCGNHPFGDFHYRFWKDVGCDCCSFFRGIVVGCVYSGILFGLVMMVL